MKLKWNKKYGKISAYAIGVIVISGVLLFLFQALPDVRSAFEFVAGVISPVLWGCVIAYILNPVLFLFEDKVFAKWKKKCTTRKKQRAVRRVSLLITVILALAVLVGIVLLVIPQVVNSLMNISTTLPDYIKEVEKWGHDNFSGSPEIISTFIDPLSDIQKTVGNWWTTNIQPNLSSYLSTVGSGVLAFAMGFKDFIIGLIIAAYILYSKEMLSTQFKKLLFAFVKNDICNHILDFIRRTDGIFRHYMIGIILDACFVGIVTFIGATLMNTPFPILLAVIIACTNFIPFFGPFLGGIPACLLVFMDDPIKAVWFAIFMLALQQFDGNIMVPFIQGDQTGVPSVWILIAIIIGGGLFGFGGMLLAVPVFAVIYMMGKEFVNDRLTAKQLPTATVIYEDNVGRFTTGYVYSDEERAADQVKLDAYASEHAPKKPKIKPIKTKSDITDKRGNNNEGTDK